MLFSPLSFFCFCQATSQSLCAWMSLWAPAPSVPRVISAERFLMPWIYSQGVWLGSTVDVKSSEQEGGKEENPLSLSPSVSFTPHEDFFFTLKRFHWRLIYVIDWLVFFSVLHFFLTEVSIQSINFTSFFKGFSLFVKNMNRLGQMLMNQSGHVDVSPDSFCLWHCSHRRPDKWLHSNISELCNIYIQHNIIFSSFIKLVLAHGECPLAALVLINQEVPWAEASFHCKQTWLCS